MKTYDFTLVAEEDLRGIWEYTFGRWGLDQDDTYLKRIEACCAAIGDVSAWEKLNDALPKDVRVLRCEHPYVFWIFGDRPIVIAVLHERIDLVIRLNHRL